MTRPPERSPSSYRIILEHEVGRIWDHWQATILELGGVISFERTKLSAKTREKALEKAKRWCDNDARVDVWEAERIIYTPDAHDQEHDLSLPGEPDEEY